MRGARGGGRRYKRSNTCQKKKTLCRQGIGGDLRKSEKGLGQYRVQQGRGAQGLPHRRPPATAANTAAWGPAAYRSRKQPGAVRKVGLCGATAETISARNFLRMIAAGAAAHSDHGRALRATFLSAAKGEIPGYGIKDEQKLLAVALDFGIADRGAGHESHRHRGRARRPWPCSASRRARSST